MLAALIRLTRAVAQLLQQLLELAAARQSLRVDDLQARQINRICAARLRRHPAREESGAWSRAHDLGAAPADECRWARSR